MTGGDAAAVTVEALTRVARQGLAAWRLGEARLKLIKHRENAVFEVAPADGKRYALRLHRPGYHTDVELRSEFAWMRALDAEGIHVPAMIPTADGAPYTEAVAAGNVIWQMDLVSWVDGEPLGSDARGVADPSAVDALYETMGRIAARIHNQSCRWQPPAWFSRAPWDAQHLAGDAPLWGRFWELPLLSTLQRADLLHAKRRVYRQLQDFGTAPDRYSMIHADLVPDNILVGADGVRLIDFDDAGFGWHLFELATALYFIRDYAYYGAARDALVRGYRKERPLPEAHIALLPLFLAARGFSYLGWVLTRPETDTARELAGEHVRMACARTSEYMSSAAQAAV